MKRKPTEWEKILQMIWLIKGLIFIIILFYYLLIIYLLLINIKIT